MILQLMRNSFGHLRRLLLSNVHRSRYASLLIALRTNNREAHKTASCAGYSIISISLQLCEIVELNFFPVIYFVLHMKIT